MKKLYKWLCVGAVAILCNGAPQCTIETSEEKPFSWKVHQQDFIEENFDYQSDYDGGDEKITITFRDGCVVGYYMLGYIEACCFRWVWYDHNSTIM